MRNDWKVGKLARRAVVALAAVPLVASCQTPVVSAVVDAASYMPTLGARGGIVSIFGTNLASTTASAEAVPLPRQLGGTTVTWNGIAAPLFYVSPTQINLQVPVRTDPDSGGNGEGVVVSTTAGRSAPYKTSSMTPKAWNVVGLFSVDASGCGQGAVLNVAADGSVSHNSAANSASPGDWISIYGTGITLNLVQYPPDGVPTPLTSLIQANPRGGVQFDFQQAVGLTSFAGLAPGLVGMAQINKQIPATVREGCAVPLQYLNAAGPSAYTQPVTLAIRNGGGHCADPPEAGFGQVIWQRTIATTANAVSESDTVTVSLQASPGKQAPPIPVYRDLCDRPVPCTSTSASSVTYFGPSCPVPGYRSLAAGTVTLEGPGLGRVQAPAIPFQEGQLGGLSVYQATLPEGAVQAGTYTVTASGGADVGAFQATARVGADIQLQTSLAGADVWAGCAPFTINWTGGDPNSWVTVRFIQQAPASLGGSQAVQFGYRTRTSRGALSIGFSVPGVRNPQCSVPTPITISVEVDPDPSEIVPFPAPGLSLGGRVTWKYVHTFPATIRLS